MIVAEVRLTAAPGFTGYGFTHNVQFDKIEDARRNYHEIADLLKRREDRANDLPTRVDLVGIASSVSLPLNEIRSVSLCDYTEQNAQMEGVREAYPNLNWVP